MRILWLSMTRGLYHGNVGGTAYNGGGWIASLQRLLQADARCQLGLAFLTDMSDDKPTVEEGTAYYPIYKAPRMGISKLRYYYGGYKNDDNRWLLGPLSKVVADYKPDAIHLFGLENPLAVILGHTHIPVLVHLQGMLLPCDNAFFPPGFNKSSFLWPFSLREWGLHNGYRFAKDSMHARAQRERALFQEAHYFMGRTSWDKHLSQILSPGSVYYHVDEVLRNAFYEHAGQWAPVAGKLRIISTVSNTLYKGLDLILKTARLLCEITDIDFEWNVVGVKPSDGIVRFFERSIKVQSSECHINYLGIMEEEALAQQLLSSSVFVHPSYIDNSPNSVCEAQLLGLPVIACNVGGVSSLVQDGVTGFLIPANAPYELISLLYKLLQDSTLMLRIGKDAKGVASMRHNKQKILNNLCSLYERIVESQTP